MATLFVDNLTVLDFSYLHGKRGMVGESWIVDLELTGDLDEQGMVFDFGLIKKAVKKAAKPAASVRQRARNRPDLRRPGLVRPGPARSASASST